MKKEIAICIALLLSLIGSASFAVADGSAVTGTFTALGELSIVVNNTSPAFGNIGPGESSALLFNVTNNGEIPVVVTQDQAEKDSGDLTIGDAGDLDTNEYSVEIQINATWYCIGNASNEISSSLAAEAVETYSLRVTVSSQLTKEVAEEQFSADVSASETS